MNTHFQQPIINNRIEVATSLGTFTVVVTINSTRTKSLMIDAIVLLGNASEAGWRVKDQQEGDTRLQPRFIVRKEVAQKLGIAVEQVRGQALYSRLSPCGDGMAKDANTGGYVKL